METLVPPLQRWLLFSGALLLTGTVAWRGFIAPRVRQRLAGRDAPETFDRELSEITVLERGVGGIGGLTALVLVGAWALRLWAQLMDFRDPFAPLREDLTFLVFDTFWGTVWMVQGGLVILLVGGFALLRSRAGSSPPPPPGLTPEGIPRKGHRPVELPLRWKVVAGGVFLLLLTLALSSHAMSVPANRPLAVSVDLAHTAAAGVWMGSLALILATTAARDDNGRVLSFQLEAFSPMALASVGVLLFMGLLLSGFHMHEIPALWESRYGRTLSLKVLVVLAVMAIGFWNWRRGLPSLLEADASPERTRTAEQVRRSAGLEVGLALVVLLVTAVLVATPVPPGAH